MIFEANFLNRRRIHSVTQIQSKHRELPKVHRNGKLENNIYYKHNINECEFWLLQYPLRITMCLIEIVLFVQYDKQQRLQPKTATYFLRPQYVDYRIETTFERVKTMIFICTIV